MSQFLWYDCTFKKAMYLDLWPMTYEGQLFLVNREQPYKYPVSISDRYLF